MDANSDCAFCAIIKGSATSHVVYENQHVTSFLDILPTRPGHVLVVPKAHYPRVSDLPEDVARELGAAVSKIAKALTEALENPGLTITLNQVYAQIVPHVHYHIVPAPVFSSTSSHSPPSTKGSLSSQPISFQLFPPRNELDDDEALCMTKRIKAKL